MKLSISMLFCLLLAGSSFSAGLIDISYSGITITQPGSYLVVCDLTTAQDLDCITIATSNVIIDLNGHTLYGAGTAMGTSGSGIYCGSGANIAVSNGTIRDFRGHGIYLSAGNCQVNRVFVYANGTYGILIGYNGTIFDNTVRENGSTGISTGNGAVIRGNSVRENGGAGIAAGAGCTVTDNSIYSNGGNGIYGTSGCTITDNSIYSNDNYGVYSNTACVITNNSIYANSTTGIYTGSGSKVTGNASRSNGGDGIRVTYDCLVSGNACSGNTLAGIHVAGADNSIVGNSCTNNGTSGLLSDGTNVNYFEQNKLSGNSPDESLGSSVEGGGVLANVIF